MSKILHQCMLTDIDKETVDFGSNFDDTSEGAFGSAQPVPRISW